MIIPSDIISVICKYLCIFDFNHSNRFTWINKDFQKYILENIKKIKNQDSHFYMATQIRYWRPELDYSEVVTSNFMIFDNYHSFKFWKDNSKLFNTVGF